MASLTTENLLEYEIDDSLARGIQAFLLIKGFDQEAVVERIIQRKGARAYGLTAVEDAANRRYSTGHIVATDLDRDSLDSDTLAASRWSIECLEPFGIAIQGDTLAYTSGSTVRLVDLPSGNIRAFSNSWLSFVHTVEFSSTCGNRLLASSAGLDTALEFDTESGNVTWEWNAWDNGLNRAVLNGAYVTRNKEQARAFRQDGHDVLFVDDPTSWPPEGIPTHRSPARLNGATYGSGCQILLTFYHRPEVAVVERDGQCRLVDMALDHPHGFKEIPLSEQGRYVVTDSGKGRLLFLDADFSPTKSVSFASLPADADKSGQFGEWIQTVSMLDAERGLVVAVDALRDGIHVVDLRRRRRRFLPNPPEWRVHTVVPMPQSLELRSTATLPHHG